MAVAAGAGLPVQAALNNKLAKTGGSPLRAWSTASAPAGAWDGRGLWARTRGRMGAAGSRARARRRRIAHPAPWAPSCSYTPLREGLTRQAEPAFQTALQSELIHSV